MEVTNARVGNALMTQHSVEIDDDVYKKTITRPDPNDPRQQVLEAIIIESKKGGATEVHALYERRVELLLKNLKKLYYDQPSLARRIKDNCNVDDPTKHQPLNQIARRDDRVEDSMTDKSCQTMVEFFDGHRNGSKEHDLKPFPPRSPRLYR